MRGARESESEAAGRADTEKERLHAGWVLRFRLYASHHFNTINSAFILYIIFEFQNTSFYHIQAFN